MKLITFTAVLLIFIFNMPSTYASDFRYNAIANSYAIIDIYDLDQDSTSYNFGITSNINNYMFFSASTGVEILDTVVFGNSVTTGYKLGIGLHNPINQLTDLVTHVSIIKATVDASVFVDKYTGYSFGFTTRSMLNDKLEANVGINYSEIDSVSFSSASIGAAYAINPDIQLSVGLVFSSDYQATVAGLLYYY